MSKPLNLVRKIAHGKSSAVISATFGPQVSVDNDCVEHRREERTYADIEDIHLCLQKMGLSERRLDTKSVRRTSEKIHQKKKFKQRDLDRCEKAFRDLRNACALDCNQPQLGFNVGELLAKLGAFPGHFIQSCTDLKDAVQTTSIAVKNMANLAQTAMPWLSAFLKASVVCVCASTLIYAIYARRALLAVTSAGLLSAFSLAQGYVMHADISSTLDKLSEAVSQLSPSRTVNEQFCQEKSDFPPNEAQGKPLIDLDQTMISKLFVSAFSGAFFVVGDHKTTFSGLKDYVVHFPSMVKGIDQAVDFGSKIAMSLLNKVRSTLGFETYDTLWERRDPFCEWISEVERFLDAFGNRDVKASAVSLGQINKFIQQGREHMNFMRTITDDAGLKTRLTAVLVSLSKARDTCIAVNPNVVSSRPEPVVVFLYGPPGAGKTKFAQLLAQAWLSRKLSPEEYAMAIRRIEAYIYFRTPETEFWDGYANQAVCIVDDFGQHVEVAGGPSQFLDIIRGANGAPALLHMADLGSKGATYFTSGLIIMTCNEKLPKSEAIREQKAFLRRPDFLLEVDWQDALKTESKYLGSSAVDTVMLSAINSLPAWEDRVSVYKLTRYMYNKAMIAEDIGNVAPLDLLNEIISRDEFNQAKFSNQLPPVAQDKLDEAKTLVEKFRQIQNYKKPENKPQGFSREDFSKSPGGVKAYEEFRILFDAYLTAYEHGGCTFACQEREMLTNLLKTCSLTWDEFYNQYHAEIDLADLHYLNKVRKEMLKDKHAMFAQDFPLPDKVSHTEYFSAFFTAYYSKFKTKVGELWTVFKTYWPWIVGTAAAFGVALTVYKGIQYWNAQENQPESIPAKLKSRIGKKVAKKKGFEVFKKSGPLPANESQSTQSMQQQMVKLLSHNYHIFIHEKDTKAIGHVQMVRGEIGLCNVHTCDMVVDMAREERLTSVWLQKFGKKSQRLEVRVESFSKIHKAEYATDFDIALLLFKNAALPTAPDFTRVVPPLSDFTTRSQLEIMAPLIVADDEKFAFAIDRKARINAETGPYARGDEIYSNCVNITYDLTSGPGQCGLPLVSDTLSQGKYFVGIHKCGNGVTAGAAPLFSEWFDEEIPLLMALYPDVKMPISFSDPASFEAPPNNFPQCYPAETLGVVKAHHASTDTKLRLLPHGSMFDLETAPAQLNAIKVNGVWTDPYIQNREKIPKKVPLYPDVPDLNALASGIINMDTKEQADLKTLRRRLTYEEALFGNPEIGLAGLDMSTSVGYPMVLSGKTTKKAWLANPELAADVKKQYDVALALLERGIRPVFFVMDCLKDERRSIEKVEKCATRVFSAGSFVALLLCRTFFGGFSVWTQKNKIDNGITIGMNPYSIEFDYMCRLLLKSGFKGFGGDSEKFDLTQHPTMHRAVFHGCNDWYGDGPDNKIRLILAEDFMFARHVTAPVHVGKQAQEEIRSYPLPLDPFEVSAPLKILNASNHPDLAFIYEMMCGHPSGHFLTALFNSWYSKIKPFCVLQYKLRDLQAVLEIARKKKVVAETLGDDFLISVAQELQKILNALEFAKFSKLYGMTVTREDKTPITEPFPEEELVFLKRLLRYERSMGRYVGALKQAAIVDAMCWIRKDHPTDDELTQLFNQALAEFVFWGRDVYEHMKPKIQEAARYTLRNSFVAPDWIQALAMANGMDITYRP